MGDEIKNKNNELDEQIFAVPCDVPFVVDPEKAKEFMEVKSNPELRRKNEELIKNLNIHVKVEEGPVLRKKINLKDYK